MNEPAPDLVGPTGRYEMMLTIRGFEQRVARLFEEGLIHGTAHLCIGQEACAVGAVSALRPTDPIVSNHRGHGHFLARTADPAGLMAELLGKGTGVCMGRGGSQHLCHAERAFYGTTGITGGGLPMATGLALSQKLRKTGAVVICFFGDGAANQGTFHESLNMASIWDLPVLYFCENNLYAMSTAVCDSMRVPAIADRASAYGMAGTGVDGMDVEAVRETVAEAAARARVDKGPVLIEAQCYRFCGHSKSDRLVYRTRQEEEHWRRRDPIALYRSRLLADGVDEGRLAEIERRAEALVEEVYRQAAAAAGPTPEQVLTSPYSEDSQ